MALINRLRPLSPPGTPPTEKEIEHARRRSEIEKRYPRSRRYYIYGRKDIVAFDPARTGHLPPWRGECPRRGT